MQSYLGLCIAIVEVNAPFPELCRIPALSLGSEVVISVLAFERPYVELHSIIELWLPHERNVVLSLVA